MSGRNPLNKGNPFAKKSSAKGQLKSTIVKPSTEKNEEEKKKVESPKSVIETKVEDGKEIEPNQKAIPSIKPPQQSEVDSSIIGMTIKEEPKSDQFLEKKEEDKINTEVKIGAKPIEDSKAISWDTDINFDIDVNIDTNVNKPPEEINFNQSADLHEENKISAIATEPIIPETKHEIEPNSVIETNLTIEHTESQSAQYEASNNSPEGKAVVDTEIKDSMEQTGISIPSTINLNPIPVQEEVPKNSTEQISEEKQSERGGNNAIHIESQRYMEEEKNISLIRSAESKLSLGTILLDMQKKLNEQKLLNDKLRIENEKCIIHL